METNKYDIEIQNITFVKTVCMIFVVFYHSVLFWNENWFIGNPVFYCRFWKIVSQWLNSFHIYTFTFISGYLFYFNKYELGKYNSFKVFFTNKFNRLLLPYFIISTFWVIPISYPFYHWSFSDIIHNFLLMEAPSQLWFLVMLFGVYIFSFFMKSIYKKHTFLSSIVVLFLYFSVSFLSKKTANYFGYHNVFKFLLFFFLGFKYRQDKNLFLRKIPFYVFIVFDFIIFYLWYFLFSKSELLQMKIFSRFVLLVLQIIGTLMCFSTFQFLGMKRKKGIIINLLSKNSMTIYLLHQQIIYILIVLFNGKINPYIHGIVNFIFSLSGALVLSVLLHSNKRICFFIGDK